MQLEERYKNGPDFPYKSPYLCKSYLFTLLTNKILLWQLSPSRVRTDIERHAGLSHASVTCQPSSK